MNKFLFIQPSLVETLNFNSMISKLYLVDWESNGQTFFQDVTLSSEVKPYVQIYTFYRSKEIPPTLLSNFRTLHTPKECALVSRFNDVNWKSLACNLVSRDNLSTIQQEKDICVVSKQPLRYFGEIMRIFQESGANYRVVDTEECDLLQEFEYKCLICRKVFISWRSLERHNKTSCLYLAGCKKLQCIKKSKRIEINSKNINGSCLTLKCESCSTNCIETYSTRDRNRKHEMRSVHKNQYVGKTHSCWTNHDTREYTSHFFFSYDVLPCLAVSGCPHMFRTVQEQAHHHMTEHGCRKPYFCSVCYRTLKFMCFESEADLLHHGKLAGHCEPDFAFV